MNKRQIKNNAKNAMINVIEDEATAKDWHVLTTYGRKYFQQKTGYNPELLKSDIAEVFKTVKRVFIAVLKAIGEAFIAISEGMDFED